MNLFILFILFCNVDAYFDSDKLNVGTVLFKKNDFKKKCWNVAAIDLLEARKHLQNILPSPNLVESINDEYLDHLLQYFDHSYGIIKRDVQDPATKSLMKYALSDAIGGYIKSWVLPVSKYSYYGGTISLENVLKVTKVYDDIKKELHTDGEGWIKDEKLISYFPIDVATSKVRNTRFYDGSCDDLAYYQKSDSGYSVPVPVINWDICPSTMFVPLKNPSLISLDSTNSSTSLVNYYELIQNCVNNIDNWKDFDDRFQTWLMTDVAPHLGDDCLYVPFGGVLGLMNQSTLPNDFFKPLKSSYNKIIDSCNSNGTLFLFSGKKIIIAIIIFVEMLWCIPALYYMICKKKKRKRRWSLLFCFKRKIKKDAFYVGTSSDDDTDSERYYFSSSTDRSYNTINDFQPSIYGTEYSNVESDSQDKLISVSHKHIPAVDKKYIESKPLLKSNSFKTKPVRRDTIETECEQNKICIKKSKSRQSQKLKQSAPSSEKILQNFHYSQYYIKNKTKEACENTVYSNGYHIGTREHKTTSPQVTKEPYEEKSKEKVDHNTLTQLEEKCNTKTSYCPCTSNINNEVYTNKSSAPKKRERKLFKIRKRTIEVRREETAMKNRNNNGTIREDTVPTLHINIARPETEIKVDISKYKQYTKRNIRPSKIPRLNAAGIKETDNEKPFPQKKLQSHWIKGHAIVNANEIELQENDREKLNVTY